MKTISKRELNQQTARVLAEVREDEPVYITERGVPRWRIEATDGSDDPLARLRAQGRVVERRKKPLPWPDDWEQRAHGRTPDDVDALVAAMREDR
ncbi:MAG TPA: type II toxin-antitoxin system prevent-host-death family antitoxin [Rhodanobacteraceae bacterium]